MVWVILAVILTALATAWIMMRRRYAAMRTESAEPAAVAPPHDHPSEVEEASEPAVAAAGRAGAEESAAAPERRGRQVEAAAIAEEAEAEEEAEAVIEPTPVSAAESEVPAVSPRAQVETQLDESARLLDELRAAASAAEEGSPLNTESVEIMEEGLQEIRVLAERKQWGQARDKGKALHAQLTLLLQSARREKSP